MNVRQPELLTYDEAARLLDPMGTIGVTHRSIRRHIAQGRLNRVKVGRKPAVLKREVLALMREMEPCRPTTSQASGTATEPISSAAMPVGASVRSARARETRKLLNECGESSRSEPTGNVTSFTRERLRRSATPRSDI